MALVALLDGLGEMAPELLARAAGPGRVRGVALDLWAAATSDRARAGLVLSRGLREARALHSAERRLVQEVLYGWIRREQGLTSLVGPEPLAGWLGNLVLDGLPAGAAGAQVPGAWEELGSRWAALGEGLSPRAALALRHSLPEGLAARLVDQLGPAEAEALFAACATRAPLTLRANRRRGTRAALAGRLGAEGIRTTPLRVADGLRVEGRANVQATAAFRGGAFEVQDEGSQRLLELVGEAGTVLDLCAGAGGKALALADRGARVVAADVRARALEELSRRAHRAGVRLEAVLLAGSALPPALARRRFDVVLVDAPCSGTGVLRRHPEDRWRWSEERVSELVALQGELLDRAAEQVGPGGRLIYATCSVDHAEDEGVVDAFLGRHPEWRVLEALRTWPHRDDTDGFYGCALTRG